MLHHALRRSLAAPLLAAGLAACASGPSDFMAVGPIEGGATASQRVRTADERSALGRDLTETGNQQGRAARSAGSAMPSAMALAIIRQQQNEEARALLRQSSEGRANCPDGTAGNPGCVSPNTEGVPQ